MYQDKFVVAIKHNGKILRENKDLVQLPFGSEFTVLVKNLNSRRAKFKLHIDGTDVLDGTEIIVNANSEVEMKRFIRNGNMDEGNAYKFIERTQQIEDGPRGIKADDGVVRVEFCYEKAPAQVIDTVYRTHHETWWDRYPYRTYSSTIGGSLGSAEYSTKSADVKTKGLTRSATASLQNASLSASAETATAYNASADMSPTMDSFVPPDVNTAGITVPGSKVEQKFTTVYGFNAETQSHVMILRLVGRTANDIEVVAPVTVKTKNICSTCSHTNKHSSKFCSQCGTALFIV